VLIGAFVIIVLLTWVLAVMNIRSVVLQFTKDHNLIRLYSYLAVLLIMASTMIGVASAVIQRAMDVETYLKLDEVSTTRFYRR